MNTPQPSWVFERGSFWSLDLLPEANLPAPIFPNLPAVLTEVGRDSAEPLARAMGLSDKQPVLQRLAGRRCFTAQVGPTVAAYCWVSTVHECIGEMEHELRLPPGEAYIWDCATRPEFRGQRLYGSLLSHITGQLRCEGLQRIWIGASLDNHPSLRAFARAGFQQRFIASYLRLFNLACLVLAKSPAALPNSIAALKEMLASPQEHTWGPILFNYSSAVQLPPCLQPES
ncbi:MAG: GNAT family N-acetyltransferase [Anaerolineaceae bacterium]|nr:GNAT family N-acetyltransferase [Anaerolineaceae bacterium]